MMRRKALSVQVKAFPSSTSFRQPARMRVAKWNPLRPQSTTQNLAPVVEGRQMFVYLREKTMLRRGPPQNTELNHFILPHFEILSNVVDIPQWRRRPTESKRIDDLRGDHPQPAKPLPGVWGPQARIRRLSYFDNPQVSTITPPRSSPYHILQQESSLPNRNGVTPS